MGTRAFGRLLFWVGLTLALSAGRARADFVTGWMNRQTPDATHPGVSFFGPTQTDWGVTPTSPPGTAPVSLFVDQFNKNDPNVLKVLPPMTEAKLTEVDLRLDYAFDNTLSARYVTMATITVNANGTLHVSVPGNTANQSLDGSFQNSGSRASTPSDIMPGAPPVTINQVNPTGQSPARAYSDTGTLALFTGAGQVALPSFAQATSGFNTTSGNGSGSSLTHAFALVEVQYHFIAIGVLPEPASVGLMAVGLASVAGWEWRRRRKAAASA